MDMKSRGAGGDGRVQSLGQQAWVSKLSGSTRKSKAGSGVSPKRVLLGSLILAVHIVVLTTFLWERAQQCGPLNAPSSAAWLLHQNASEGNAKSAQAVNASTPGTGRTEGGYAGPRFILYRLIGNNMPPLQCSSQLLWNTLYALEHEGDLAGCHKRWVLNQIMNSTERALLLDALIRRGYSLQDILIRSLNWSQVAARPRSKWLELVTAQNEARNAALEDGIRAGARWILPFDGNHFITQEAWGAIVRSADAAERQGFKYFKVPVHRLHKEHNPQWVNANSTFAKIMPYAPLMIESQLAFRRDAEARFRSGMLYGQQNKLELLARTCGNPQKSTYIAACGCANVGIEGQPHKSNLTKAAECGYSLRLWFYPCPSTDPQKVFMNGLYRRQMRTEARRQLSGRIRRALHQRGLLPV